MCRKICLFSSSSAIGGAAAGAGASVDAIPMAPAISTTPFTCAGDDDGPCIEES